MEHLEVMPVSSRVVCLNAPHLKSLCVFEALSRILGYYYNHHRLQVGPIFCPPTITKTLIILRKTLFKVMFTPAS